ncbi:unnamed protein product [Sphagnum jensenii]
MVFEEELRETVNRTREEEQRNITKLVRSQEQKVKALEEAREVSLLCDKLKSELNERDSVLSRLKSEGSQ